MRRFLRRIAACAVLFCTNPRSFLYAAAYPASPQGRELRRLLRSEEK